MFKKKLPNSFITKSKSLKNRKNNKNLKNNKNDQLLK